jgi:hypothetical protein
MRRSRGHDLAYLTALPPDQARARRMVHDAVDSDIAVARIVGAHSMTAAVTEVGTLPPTYTIRKAAVGQFVYVYSRENKA